MTRYFPAIAAAVLIAAGVLAADGSRVITAGYVSGKTTEVVLPADAGYASMPTTALSGRKAIEIQNNAPTVIKCRVGSGSYVREIPADGVWAVGVADTIVIGCQSPAGDQASGNAVSVSEFR